MEGYRWLLMICLLFVVMKSVVTQEPTGSSSFLSRNINTEKLVRNKREIYFTFQDRAQVICIGLCMFNERKTYYGCEKNCKIGRVRNGKSRKHRTDN